MWPLGPAIGLALHLHGLCFWKFWEKKVAIQARKDKRRPNHRVWTASVPTHPADLHGILIPGLSKIQEHPSGREAGRRGIRGEKKTTFCRFMNTGVLCEQVMNVIIFLLQCLNVQELHLWILCNWMWTSDESWNCILDTSTGHKVFYIWVHCSV